MRKYKIKNMILNIVPQKIRYFLIHLLTFRNSKKSNQEIFSKIYHSNTWQENHRSLDKFYSGKGSDDFYSEQYIGLIRQFVKDNNVNEIIDLGCGDFRVGSKLVDLAIAYTGIDIVPELIQFHNNYNSKSNVNFMCLDITKDKVPHGMGGVNCV